MHYGASEDTQKQSQSSLMIERLLFFAACSNASGVA